MKPHKRYFRCLVLVLSLPLSLPTMAEPRLENNYWRAISIGGQRISLEIAQIPHIAFHEQDNRVAGFGGCNRFFATYRQQDMNLTMSIMGGGRANCPETSEVEQKFLRSLQRTQSFKITSGKLFLLDDKEVLAEFLGVER